MANYLFIDIETTGLGKNAAVIELAAIPVIDGEEKSHFHSMVRPHKDATLDPKAFETTKIDIKDIWNFPDANGVMNEFYKWVESHETKFNLGGHNVTFDRRFLFDVSCRNAKYGDFISNFRNRDLDTLAIARKIYKGKKIKPSSFALEELCSYFEIQTSVHHRALDDIQNTIKVYRELDKLISQEEVKLEALSYNQKKSLYLDMKYIQMNSGGDVFLTKEAMSNPHAMRFILNELYDLSCDPLLSLAQ